MQPEVLYKYIPSPPLKGLPSMLQNVFSMPRERLTYSETLDQLQTAKRSSENCQPGAPPSWERQSRGPQPAGLPGKVGTRPRHVPLAHERALWAAGVGEVEEQVLIQLAVEGGHAHHDLRARRG